MLRAQTTPGSTFVTARGHFRRSYLAAKDLEVYHKDDETTAVASQMPNSSMGACSIANILRFRSVDGT